MVKRKQDETRQLEIQCDCVISDIILWVDKGKCALCEQAFSLSAHHIQKRGIKNVRHNPNNLILLCGTCHDQAEHSHEWFLEQLEKKYPLMYEWYEANRHHEIMQFYNQHLEKTYKALKIIQTRMRAETDEMRKRFLRA